MEEANDLDPRIQIELEKLNYSTKEINNLEKELDEANGNFRQLLSQTTGDLEQLSRNLGSAIDKARPFYEALAEAQKAHRLCHEAAIQFQRANGVYQAAKEKVSLAEQKFSSTKDPTMHFDDAWQEVLNHATMKVMEAETMKAESELRHQKLAEDFSRSEKRVQDLNKSLRREIMKSRPYFEMKDRLNSRLDAVKARTESLQVGIQSAKRAYAQTLQNLEEISEEIHLKRRTGAVNGMRTPGVGAEADEEKSIESLDVDNSTESDTDTSSRS